MGFEIFVIEVRVLGLDYMREVEKFGNRNLLVELCGSM